MRRLRQGAFSLVMVFVAMSCTATRPPVPEGTGLGLAGSGMSGTAPRRWTLPRNLASETFDLSDLLLERDEFEPYPFLPLQLTWVDVFERPFESIRIRSEAFPQAEFRDVQALPRMVQFELPKESDFGLYANPIP